MTRTSEIRKRRLYRLWRISRFRMVRSTDHLTSARANATKPKKKSRTISANRKPAPVMDPSRPPKSDFRGSMNRGMSEISRKGNPCGLSPGKRDCAESFHRTVGSVWRETHSSSAWPVLNSPPVRPETSASSVLERARLRRREPGEGGEDGAWPRSNG